MEGHIAFCPKFQQLFLVFSEEEWVLGSKGLSGFEMRRKGYSRPSTSVMATVRRAVPAAVRESRQIRALAGFSPAVKANCIDRMWNIPKRSGCDLVCAGSVF